jgi:hypothetical protein
VISTLPSASRIARWNAFVFKNVPARRDYARCGIVEVQGGPNHQPGSDEALRIKLLRDGVAVVGKVFWQSRDRGDNGKADYCVTLEYTTGEEYRGI